MYAVHLYVLFMAYMQCIFCNINQWNAHFSNEYSYSIFQFLTSSARFKPHGFILRKTVINTIFVWYVYMHWCKQLKIEKLN